MRPHPRQAAVASRARHGCIPPASRCLFYSPVKPQTGAGLGERERDEQHQPQSRNPRHRSVPGTRFGERRARRSSTSRPGSRSRQFREQHHPSAGRQAPASRDRGSWTSRADVRQDPSAPQRLLALAQTEQHGAARVLQLGPPLRAITDHCGRIDATNLSRIARHATFASSARSWLASPVWVATTDAEPFFFGSLLTWTLEPSGALTRQ